MRYAILALILLAWVLSGCVVNPMPANQSLRQPLNSTTEATNTTQAPVNQSGAAPAPGSIPASFFGMSDVDAEDPPHVPYGVIGHPQFAWAMIETSRGVYNWTLIDKYVEMAPKDGDGAALILLTLGKTPSWAVKDQSTCHGGEFTGSILQCSAPPDNISDWKDFISALVGHYDGVTAPHVKYYEIWNEVNNPGGPFFNGTQEQLVELSRTAYPIIHKDPYSMVISPSTCALFKNAVPYYQDYLQKGGNGFADIGVFHGYGPAKTGPEFIVDQVQEYRQALDQNGMAGKPLINSEGSWGKDTFNDTDMKAAWIARYMILQAGLYRSDNLQVVSWFTWGGGGKQPWGNIETNSHKPDKGGLAYAEVYGWLVGSMVDPCVQKEDVWTCDLTLQNGKPALIAWDDSQTCDSGTCTTSSYTLPRKYAEYRDLDGGAAPVSGPSVKIGAKPILLD